MATYAGRVLQCLRGYARTGNTAYNDNVAILCNLSPQSVANAVRKLRRQGYRIDVRRYGEYTVYKLHEG